MGCIFYFCVTVPLRLGRSLCHSLFPKRASAAKLYVLILVTSPGRLVEDEERRWTDENINMVALKHFPNIDRDKALTRPILYSNWLSKVSDRLSSTGRHRRLRDA